MQFHIFENVIWSVYNYLYCGNLITCNPDYMNYITTLDVKE